MGRLYLVVIFVLALGVRLIFLSDLVADPMFAVLVGDSSRFDAWAREIAAGDLLGDEVFFHAPLYPYFLAGVYALGGPDVLLARVVQAVLGAAASVLVAVATDRLLGRRIALLAGVIAALYAPAIWLDALIQKTALAGFLTAALLCALALHITSPRVWRAIVAGVLLGLLALVRENALVLLPVLAAWFACGRPFESIGTKPSSRTWTTVLFLVSAALVLVPVLVRNARVGGSALPTTSNVGISFYQGNGAAADGLYVPLVRGRGHTEYERADAERIAEQELGRELTAAEVSGYWFRRGWDDVRSDPGRWAQLMGRKALLVVNRAEPMDGEALEAYVDRSALLAALARYLHFGLLLPLALVGIGTTWVERRRLWPIWACALALGLSLIAFFVMARFRMGLVPFLIVFAAAGVVELFARLRTAGKRRGALVWVIVLLATAWLANRPAGLTGDPRATTYSNLASEELRRGDWSAAESWARAALQHDEESAEASWNLAVALNAGGQPEEAERWFKRAMELQPEYTAEGAARLGVLRALRGEYAEAAAFLEESLSRDPDAPRVYYDLGLVRRNLGDLGGAARSYEESIWLDPTFPDAHHNLGYVRRLQGRWAEAVEHYRAALEADPEFIRSMEELALILATHPDPALRDGAEAVRLAERALELLDDPHWGILDVLAAAQAETGAFVEAQATIERARLATDDQEVRRELDGYARRYARRYPRRLTP